MVPHNEHLLMKEAHRRVADRLREAELDRFDRRPPRPVRLAVAAGVTVAAVAAAIVGFVVLPF